MRSTVSIFSFPYLVIPRHSLIIAQCHVIQLRSTYKMFSTYSYTLSYNNKKIIYFPQKMKKPFPHHLLQIHHHIFYKHWVCHLTFKKNIFVLTNVKNNTYELKSSCVIHFSILKKFCRLMKWHSWLRRIFIACVFKNCLR